MNSASSTFFTLIRWQQSNQDLKQYIVATASPARLGLELNGTFRACPKATNRRQESAKFREIEGLVEEFAESKGVCILAGSNRGQLVMY